MAHHRGVAAGLRQPHRVDCLGQAADLVNLDQYRVGDAVADSLRQALLVGHEQVVPNQLRAAAEPLGERLPAGHVVFPHAILDGGDRVVAGKFLQESGHFVRRQAPPLARHLVLAVLEELGCRAIERDQHIVAKAVAGRVDCLADKVERSPRRGDVWREPALVADRRRQPGAMQLALQRMEDLRAAAQRFGKAVCADRHHHEFLEVDRVVGMRAAVEDVHHRHRQDAGADPTDIAVERQAARLRRRLGHRQRDAQDRIGAQLALILGPIERDQLGIDVGLVFRFEADDRFGNRAVHRFHGLADALAAPPALVAVAQLHRLVRAGGCARRDGGPAHAAVLECHVHLDSRIAAAIEDLAGVDVEDGGHVSLAPSGSL